jgi:RNA 3'-terminal phosphate cyclase (ATP)
MRGGDLIVIDGSFGEGGGQILRTSLSLSMVTGRQFRIDNIRAGRDKPGLLRQHLTAVRAAAEVCGAAVEGDAIGSRSLRFSPGPIRSGEYAFSIGTAGSTTLVLQTVLPALLRAPGASRVVIEGGTHNPHAPTVDFLTRAFLPLLRKMGASVELTLDRHGFYPAGGGRITARIGPAPVLRPLELSARGEIVSREAVATIAALSGEIAKRELRVVAEMLGWGAETVRISQLEPGRGPGNVVSITLASEHVTEVFTSFGVRGLSAEAVARGAVGQVRDYLRSGAPVWEHLADQLVLPLALAGGGRFVTGPLSAHARTNIAVTEKFLDIRTRVLDSSGGNQCVVVGP